MPLFSHMQIVGFLMMWLIVWITMRLIECCKKIAKTKNAFICPKAKQAADSLGCLMQIQFNHHHFTLNYRILILTFQCPILIVSRVMVIMNPGSLKSVHI